MIIEDKFEETFQYLALNPDLLEKHSAYRETGVCFDKCKNIKNDIIYTIKNKVENVKHYQFYLDYVIGYSLKKLSILVEDIENAVDVAKFYRENKHQYDDSYAALTPIELGVIHEDLQTKMLSIKQVSKNHWTKLKTEGVLLPEMNFGPVYKDETYTIFKIPVIIKEDEESKEKQHLLYCYVGKGTKWCTANPIGTYYSYYIKDDVYAVWKDGVPLYQFNIRNNEVNQFMDVNDSSVDILPKSLIDILEEIVK